jgi:hypothetical protein
MRRPLGLTLLVAAALAMALLVGRSTAPASEIVNTRQAAVDVGLDRIIPELKFDKTPCDGRGAGCAAITASR